MNFDVVGTRKSSVLCLLYKIYHRMDHPMNEYLKHLVADRNTRTSSALCEGALVDPRCRADQFSQSCLPAAVRLWNMLLSGVFSGGTLGSFKSAVTLCLLRT